MRRVQRVHQDDNALKGLDLEGSHHKDSGNHSLGSQLAPFFFGKRLPINIYALSPPIASRRNAQSQRYLAPEIDARKARIADQNSRGRQSSYHHPIPARPSASFRNPPRPGSTPDTHQDVPSTYPTELNTEAVFHTLEALLPARSRPRPRPSATTQNKRKRTAASDEAPEDVVEDTPSATKGARPRPSAAARNKRKRVAALDETPEGIVGSVVEGVLEDTPSAPKGARPPRPSVTEKKKQKQTAASDEVPNRTPSRPPSDTDRARLDSTGLPAEAPEDIQTKVAGFMQMFENTFAAILQDISVRDHAQSLCSEFVSGLTQSIARASSKANVAGSNPIGVLYRQLEKKMAEDNMTLPPASLRPATPPPAQPTKAASASPPPDATPPASGAARPLPEASSPPTSSSATSASSSPSHQRAKRTCTSSPPTRSPIAAPSSQAAEAQDDARMYTTTWSLSLCPPADEVVLPGLSTSPQPTSEPLDHREPDNISVNEGESVGAGEAQPPKKRRARPTLEETYHLVDSQHQPVELTGNRPLVPWSLTFKRLQSKLRARSSQPDMDFPEADLVILGNVFFADIFGDSGQSNFFRCIRDAGLPSGWDVQASWVTAKQARKKLETLGQPELAALAVNWSHVTSCTESLRSPLGKMLLARRKVSLVQQWLSFEKLPAAGREELSQFLTGQGHPPAKRRPLESRLGAYMAELLKLGKTRHFSDRIYRWKPGAILVDAFGLGILPFIPSTFEARCRGLTSKGDMSKENKLATAAEVLRAEIPELQRICDLALERFVKPILAGAPPTVGWPAGASLDRNNRPTVLTYLEAPLIHDPSARGGIYVAKPGLRVRSVKRSGRESDEEDEEGEESEESQGEEGEEAEESEGEGGEEAEESE